MSAMTNALPKRGSASRDELLNGPIVRILLRLAAPTVAVILAQTLFSIVETYWIGKLGTAALAGASLVVPMVVLMTTMSHGGMGGGVSSAMARVIGTGDRDAAERLLWHAIMLALLCGAFFTVVLIGAGPIIYGALGGKGPALEVALTYSNWSFAAAVPMWMANMIGAALRGAGDPITPARVSLIGAVIAAFASPALIFGAGPLPALGVAGAGVAFALYYIGSLVVLVRHLCSGRGVLTLRIGRLERSAFVAILKVGLAATFGTLLMNLTIVAVTGAVGMAGATALAGYGIASRLDSLLVPLLFGPGTAVITMIGTAVGAGRHERARRVAMTAAVIAALVLEIFGATIAYFPALWTGLFTSDPAVAGVAGAYLGTVAPFYGALGLGLTLYFAAQGTGEMAWPLSASVARVTVAAGGGWLASGMGFGLAGVFGAVAGGIAVYGLISLAGHAFMGRAGKGQLIPVAGPLPGNC